MNNGPVILMACAVFGGGGILIAAIVYSFGNTSSSQPVRQVSPSGKLTGVLRFQNPDNGYEETVTSPGFWCLLCGPLYFAHKGAWSHAAISTVAAVCTGGLSWIVYPFFARKAVITSYLRRGWRRVDGIAGDIQISR